ncbi:MAG: hypothetical protein SPE95_01830, partial [Oscillospiraceae bacterium]|nr:hypothetical protein [Oscillospiraceae bacterium]
LDRMGREGPYPHHSAHTKYASCKSFSPVRPAIQLAASGRKLSQGAFYRLCFCILRVCRPGLILKKETADR